MTQSKKLDELPEVVIEEVRDRSDPERPDGFLQLRRLVLRNRYADGSRSREYRYDMVERVALDAVAIVLFVRQGESFDLCLRSSVRPPIVFRERCSIPLEEALESSPCLWEVPAGLVEPAEKGVDGLKQCAARETLEEVGLEVAPNAFWLLGHPCFLSPGLMGEQVHFLAAEVDPETRGVPLEDGSPVEERAEIRFVPASEALGAIESGEIRDVKTEVSLRRLVAHLASS